MKKLYIILIFLSLNIYSQQFVDINPFPSHQSDLIVTPQFADLNGDGWLDVFANRMIYINNKNGTFSNYFIYPIALIGYFNGYITTSLGDYNNDGSLDILATYRTNLNTNESKIFKNLGRDSAGFWLFEDINANLKGVYNIGMVKSHQWGDIDNDGDLDILFLGNSLGTTEVTPFAEVYINDKGNFKALNSGIMGFKNGTAQLVDYDGDGDLDIVISGNVTESSATSPYTRVYQNNNGKFTETQIDLLNVEESSVAWGDYDMDGKPDIFITGRVLAPFSALYHNDGNGKFTLTPNTFDSKYWGDASWGDLDNDGDLDLIISGENLNTPALIYKNNNGNFIAHDSLTNGRIAVTSLGDFDNDGDLDILFASFMNKITNSFFSIFRNDINLKNTPPEMPTGLKSLVNGNNVTLSWNKSNDKETKSEGLTYNLYVGNALNKISVITPHSDLKTGKRYLSDYGNNQLNLSKIIKGLPDGVYYWSVQAIDNSFEPSKFAPEQSFTIGNPPKIDTLKLIEPNGGEIYNASQTINIKWDGLLASDTVMLEYSLDNGLNWHLINNKAINKNYNWTAPDTQSTKCLARVSSMLKIEPSIIQRFENSPPFVQYINYSKDGKKLLSYSLDSNFRIWDIMTGSELRKFKNYNSPSEAWSGFLQNKIKYSLDNSLILTTENYMPNSFITIWNEDASSKVFEIFFPNRQFIIEAAISPENKYLAVAYETEAFIYDITQSSIHDPIKKLKFSEIYYAIDIAFSNDGKYLAVASYDSSLTIFLTHDWSIFYRQKFNQMINSIDFNNKSSNICIGSTDGNIYIFNILKHTIESNYSVANYISSAYYSRDDSMILFNNIDDKTGIFDIASNKVLCYLYDSKKVADGKISPDMKFAATTDSIIKIWELNPIMPYKKTSASNWTILKDAKSPFVEIEIPQISAKINETIEIPIILKNTQNLSNSSITGIKTTLIFNGNILYPAKNTPFGTLTNNIRKIDINLPIAPIEKNILAKFNFEVLLGDTDYTEIKFENSEFIGSKGIIQDNYGKILITNICRDGGNRFVKSIRAFNISPNPANEYIEVSKSDNYSDIFIYNSLGECIMQIDDKALSSTHRIDISELPQGIYFLKIETSIQKFIKY